MAAEGGRIDFMFLGLSTRPLDPLLLLKNCIFNFLRYLVFYSNFLKIFMIIGRIMNSAGVMLQMAVNVANTK